MNAHPTGRPKLLDLFCGAGGAAMGYHRAGFDVTGVDIKAQPRYPFAFIQADALDYCRKHGRAFDAIHASPPCQAYSSATMDRTKHPDLYAKTRTVLVDAARPYAIENVIGAPCRYGVVLCGSMFGCASDGEWVRRHRTFETSFLILQPECRHPASRPILVTSKSYVRVLANYGKHSRQVPFALACRMMGIDWMTRRELAQAIPPAYTEYVGKRLMEHMKGGAS